MEICFHGHSCVEITHDTHRLIIDPFLTHNPVAKAKPAEIKVDYVLLTHSHGDHIGDAEQIAKENNATIIATYELAKHYEWKGLPTHSMAVGGGFTFPFGRVKFTQALHGSGIEDEVNQTIAYMGNPAGIILTIGEMTMYHAGDTGIFGDMKLLGEMHKIDLAFLPIGDNYTMGPDDAVLAAKMLGAKEVVPIHYNTFPIIAQDAQAFAKKCQQAGIQARIMEAGDTYIPSTVGQPK